MKNITEDTKVWKVVSGAIVGLIAAGTLLVAGVANLPAGSGVLGNLFIFFIGAIIAVQLVPGLILFSAMVKGIIEAARKEREL